jgi:hypothetical protein
MELFRPERINQIIDGAASREFALRRSALEQMLLDMFRQFVLSPGSMRKITLQGCRL